MSKEQSSTEGAYDVPKKVFKDFIDALTSAGVSDDIVTRLNKALLEDQVYTEQAFRMAIFPEDKR